MSLTFADTHLNLLNNRTDDHQSARYCWYAFAVPAGMGQLTLSLEITTEKSAQVPLILFDAKGQVRLMRAANATTGNAITSYTITPAWADKGCIPGPLPAGEWKLILYKRRMFEDIDARLTVRGQPAGECPPDSQIENPHIAGLREKPFAQETVDTRPGWYCGELHTHSDESTGYTTLFEVVDAARALHLDFIALTDHFTAAHWMRLQEAFDGERPLLLQSMELSADYGHANIHGLTAWQNPLVDDNEELAAFLGLAERPTMESIADEAHRQGGLFCLNHALSGIFGWRYREFPLEKADLYEVYCTPEMQTAILYTTHWDSLLTQGYRLTGVGSSDSHHPTDGGPWQLGHVLTWVYADSLSQADILAALRKGHAYVGVAGARMRMVGEGAGQTAQMGDTIVLAPGERATISVELPDHPRGNLFAYADGMMLDAVYYAKPGTDTYEVTLDEKWIAPRGESYVRIEFHEMAEEPAFYGLAFRDHLSVRLISNPIWLKRKETKPC